MSSHEEIKKCVSCSKSNPHIIVSIFAGKDQYTSISTCLNCGLVFRNYRWTLRETTRRYNEFDNELSIDWKKVTIQAQEDRRCNPSVMGRYKLQEVSGNKIG